MKTLIKEIDKKKKLVLGTLFLLLIVISMIK